MSLIGKEEKIPPFNPIAPPLYLSCVGSLEQSAMTGLTLPETRCSLQGVHEKPTDPDQLSGEREGTCWSCPVGTLCISRGGFPEEFKPVLKEERPLWKRRWKVICSRVHAGGQGWSA